MCIENRLTYIIADQNVYSSEGADEESEDLERSQWNDDIGECYSQNNEFVDDFDEDGI